jgi:hypothetical protein
MIGTIPYKSEEAVVMFAPCSLEEYIVLMSKPGTWQGGKPRAAMPREQAILKYVDNWILNHHTREKSLRMNGQHAAILELLGEEVFEIPPLEIAPIV